MTLRRGSPMWSRIVREAPHSIEQVRVKDVVARVVVIVTRHRIG